MSRVRAAALALPEAVEADHHGRPSFRIGGRIIATLPDDDTVHVMVGEDDARAAVAEHPDGAELLWWGRRLAGLRLDVRTVPVEVVAELLDEAWRRRAPARLLHGRTG